MSHGDTITDLPEGFNIITSTKDVKVVHIKFKKKPLIIQFHPEVYHSTDGKTTFTKLSCKYRK